MYIEELSSNKNYSVFIEETSNEQEAIREFDILARSDFSHNNDKTYLYTIYCDGSEWVYPFWFNEQMREVFEGMEETALSELSAAIKKYFID